MGIRQTTRQIIQSVEETSGFPVRVIEEPELEKPAIVRLARQGSGPGHTILYRPDAAQTPDYRICYECGYILRLFANPPEKRFDLAAAQQGREEVEEMMLAAGGVAAQYALDRPQVQALGEQYLGGLLTHLRSAPVGLRISSWLAASYPELQPLEAQHVQEELKINRQLFQAEIKHTTPARVFQAAQAINAAYALFWSQRYAKPEIFNPYRLEGLERTAQALLDIFEQTPAGPTQDWNLVDGWAEEVGINGWYAWVPYQPPV